MKTRQGITGPILAALMLLVCQMAAGQPTDQRQEEELTVSFLTCEPGPEIYELCGHEAIRVRGAGIDSVWNYGTFDFREPNFVYRFVKGETDYMLQGYPSAWFLPEYVARGSRVIEQDINLTPEEARRFLALLREESKPRNCRYRYNYVRDNCATRIIDRLEEAANAKPVYPDSLSHRTFREAMRHYHRNYPWYQFGIDMVLGRGLDIPVSPREGMFAPLEMERLVQGAHFPDGRPLVKARRVIYEGRGDVTLPPTPWLLTPLAITLMMLAVSIGIVIYDIIRKLFSRWWWSVVFGIYGLAGTIVAFLVFFSSHEATSPNLMLILLNPLQLLFAVCIWFRGMRIVSAAMSLYNFFGIGCMMLVWPFQTQSSNPAFWPMMATAVILGGAYTLLKSYAGNNREGKSAIGNTPSRTKNKTGKKRTKVK